MSYYYIVVSVGSTKNNNSKKGMNATPAEQQDKVLQPGEQTNAKLKN